MAIFPPNSQAQAPCCWRWGGPQASIDVVFQAEVPPEQRQSSTRLGDAAEGAGVEELLFTPLPSRESTTQVARLKDACDPPSGVMLLLHFLSQPTNRLQWTRHAHRPLAARASQHPRREKRELTAVPPESWSPSAHGACRGYTRMPPSDLPPRSETLAPSTGRTTPPRSPFRPGCISLGGTVRKGSV